MIRPFVQSFVRPFVQQFTGGAAGPSYESIVAIGSLGPNVTFSRLSTGTYFDSTPIMQTAAANVPRWDHDPLTGAPLGLLIEQQSTNYITYSKPTAGQFGATAQTISYGGGALGPDGIASTRLTLPNGGAPRNYAFSTYPVASFPAGDLVVSYWLKNQSTTSQWVLVYFVDPNSVGNGRAYENLVDGSVVPVDGQPLAEVVSLAGGWKRCITSGSLSAPAAVQTSTYWAQNSSGVNFVGDGTSNDVWGEQCEGGTQPTSYIPTSGSAATRAEDVLTYPDPGATGTLVITHDVPAGGNLFTATGYTLASTATGKTAIAWDASGSMTVVNGGAGITGAAISWGSAVQVLANANGHVSNCRLYSTKLTEAQMQALTA